MAYHKKLHRLLPKQVNNLDGSKSTYMAREVISENPLLGTRLDGPCSPLDYRQDFLRAKHMGYLSKSYNDLDTLDVIEGIGRDNKIRASPTSDLFENQETLPKQGKKSKKTVCWYFKKLIKQSNTKSEDLNNNNPQSKDQSYGKSDLNKFRNISKSVNCLFDRPLYNVPSTQERKEKLKEKLPKCQNKKEVTAQNKAVSYWLDTGRVLSDDPLNTRSVTKATKKSKENIISRFMKRNDNESTSSVKTEVLFKQKYGVSSYEIDSDFDGEITDTTSLPDSEDDHLISRVITGVRQSSEATTSTESDEATTSTGSLEDISMDSTISKFFVQSTACRYPGKSEESTVTRSFPQTPCREVGSGCKPVITIWTNLGSF